MARPIDAKHSTDLLPHQTDDDEFARDGEVAVERELEVEETSNYGGREDICR
jgi:hypothetical protein